MKLLLSAITILLFANAILAQTIPQGVISLSHEEIFYKDGMPDTRIAVMEMVHGSCFIR